MGKVDHAHEAEYDRQARGRKQENGSDAQPIKNLRKE
jgi:hypothetical protein